MKQAQEVDVGVGEGGEVSRFISPHLCLRASTFTEDPKILSHLL